MARMSVDEKILMMKSAIAGWVAALIVLMTVLLWPLTARADAEWGETQTVNGEWTLALWNTKVLNITGNTDPYETSILVCVKKGKDPNAIAPQICDAHDGNAHHFLIPEGFDWMVEFATEAKKEGDKVTLHVNTDPASVGMVETAGGQPRCYISRFVWSD